MSSQQARLIDRMPTVSPRPVEMQVLAFGFSRTGTMSLKEALEKLGYRSYHMIEGRNNPNAFHYWLEALKAKYRGEGKPYGRLEFDKLLGRYSAVTDIPCLMFVEELLAAYPNAKVILTERDEDGWMISMERTFFTLFSWKSLYFLTLFEPNTSGPYWKTLNLVMSIWTNGDFKNRDRLRQSYREHYNHVRAIVPKENILDFNAKDGWSILCSFLDKPVPKDEPYPHINRPDNIIILHTKLWNRVAWKAAKDIGGIILAIAVAVGAVWYYSYWR